MNIDAPVYTVQGELNFQVSNLNVFAKVFVPVQYCRKSEGLCLVNNAGNIIYVTDNGVISGATAFIEFNQEFDSIALSDQFSILCWEQPCTTTPFYDMSLQVAGSLQCQGSFVMSMSRSKSLVLTDSLTVLTC